MRARITGTSHRAGRLYLRLLLFLSAYTGLLIGVCYFYLFPHLALAKTATPDQARWFAAGALLVLVVLLFVLLAGLMLVVRIGRFFFPPPLPPRKPTIYTDAWAESARRMKTPPPEETEE